MAHEDTTSSSGKTPPSDGTPGGRPLEPLARRFPTRSALVDTVAAISPWLAPTPPSPHEGGRRQAERRLAAVRPRHYARSRNHLDGAVTQLSPYLRHGVLSLAHVKQAVSAKADTAKDAEKLIQELAWRDYFQRVGKAHPQWLWNDVEPYKTGWRAEDYAPTLPKDIAEATTGVACIDQFIRTLTETGYLHNHARMYVASYVVHWRKIRWQAGAQWFLRTLLDGDPASNNLSWQWVASTFSNKPYFFNLDNVRRYSGTDIDTSAENNRELDASYEDLHERLFPHRSEA